MNQQVNNRIVKPGDTVTRQPQERPRATAAEILQPRTRTARGICQQCRKPIAVCDCQSED